MSHFSINLLLHKLGTTGCVSDVVLCPIDKIKKKKTLFTDTNVLF